MAQWGEGRVRFVAASQALGETPQSLGPRRAQIIGKGMIYRPSHGDIALTVPMFKQYLIGNLSSLAQERAHALSLLRPVHQMGRDPARGSPAPRIDSTIVRSY
ncbi:hypothetical protein [Pandoraea sputorum]|uniref:AAA family ATPase n=1 Tax=Pandoraea sputorum TaxID=93222 RepID=A0A5E5BIT4_9BURK|nr:hypothetical protein [Pandoraea sputorum]VVE85614.1 AAA family ATPase [Pandoraea sputorum]